MPTWSTWAWGARLLPGQMHLAQGLRAREESGGDTRQPFIQVLSHLQHYPKYLGKKLSSERQLPLFLFYE